MNTLACRQSSNLFLFRHTKPFDKILKKVTYQSIQFENRPFFLTNRHYSFGSNRFNSPSTRNIPKIKNIPLDYNFNSSLTLKNINQSIIIRNMSTKKQVDKTSSETDKKPEIKDDNVQRLGFLERILNVSKHERYTFRWWIDFSTLMLVFSIAGSSCTRVSGYLLRNVFGLEGSFFGGPLSYTLSHFLCTFPIYSIILISVGTIFGHGAYCRKIAWGMWGRFLTPILKLIENSKK